VGREGRRSVSCLHSPSTLDDFRAVIEGCAIAAGGPGWFGNFALGLQTVLVVGIVLWVAFALAMRARA
jgi:hypothetical protein